MVYITFVCIGMLRFGCQKCSFIYLFGSKKDALLNIDIIYLMLSHAYGFGMHKPTPRGEFATFLKNAREMPSEGMIALRIEGAIIKFLMKPEGAIIRYLKAY